MATDHKCYWCGDDNSELILFRGAMHCGDCLTADHFDGDCDGKHPITITVLGEVSKQAIANNRRTAKCHMHSFGKEFTAAMRKHGIPMELL